jgi:acyl-CoA dehydrogenase
LTLGVEALEQATQWVSQTIRQDPNAVHAASVNYMMLTGYVCGGWQMARAAIAAKRMLASGADEGFCRAKIATARFYAEQILPKTSALSTAVKSGASTAFALDEEQF